MTTTQKHYDPMASDFQEQLYTVYEWLREEHPVYRHPTKNAWAVSRYPDVRVVLGDWRNFSSRTPAVPQPDGHLAVQDPPRHDELRRLVARVFTPRAIDALAPVVADFSDELLSAAALHSTFDLVSDFAGPLPGRVFAHMMGIPQSEVAQFQRLLNDYVAGLAPQDGGQADDQPRQQIQAKLSQLVMERRAAPQGDLLSEIVQAEVDEEKLTDHEVLGFCFNLILAANETTTNLIANGVAILSQHPVQRQRLVDEPELLPNAIEEMLRFESPVQALHRTVVNDVEVAGRLIPAGAHVQVLYGSANRDISVFSDAAAFDVGRGTQGHLAFGRGIHFCLGAHLARLEAAESFKQLLPLLSRYELASPALDWKRSPWQRSLSSLKLQVVR